MPWLILHASIDAPGKVVEERDLSQAALVSASTGHASAGVSEFLDMLWFVNEAEYKWSKEDVKFNDGSCIETPATFKFPIR